ncbi:Alpha/Beta hydrolase protein [Globomyces pollinis-pini]|nr:Alpha/Beta hydrolase protein [Globomyces pollinis-pini]
MNKQITNNRKTSKIVHLASFLCLFIWLFVAYWQPIQSKDDSLRSSYRVGSLPWRYDQQPIDESYSGFINIRNVSHNGSDHEVKKAATFYWFFPAEEPLEENPPLIIWIQGGPGSSSMIGLFYEMGPMKFDGSDKLIRNPNTWSKHASMLFIDNPVGTGFSFVGSKSKQMQSPPLEKPDLPLTPTDIPSECPTHEDLSSPKFENGYVANQEAVAHDLIVFLDRFYDIFPEQRKSKLFITGESYAGKYIPSFAYQIHRVNQNRVNEKSNSSGLPIPLSGIGIGNGFTDPLTQIKAHVPMALAFGLISQKVANQMDVLAQLAIANICKKNWSLALSYRLQLFDIFKESTGNVNWYDLRRGNQPYLRPEMYRFFDKPEVKQALNVGDAIFFKDPWVFKYLEEDLMQSAAFYIPPLLEANYQVLLYQGQFDFRDGVLSSTEWIESLNWHGQESYKSANRTIWRNDSPGQSSVAGYVTQFGNLVRVEVSNAGHLAPGDQGVNTAKMINKFLLQNDL